MENNNKRTPWKDVSFIWKKIAGVIAAVGVLATFTTQVFKTQANVTYTSFAALGFVFLMISWYVDAQAKYTYEDIEKCKTRVYEKFEEHEKEAERKVDEINQTMDDLKKLAADTRKDTLRIQLMMLMKDQPDNTDSILKIAEVYFMQLEGNWYMTSEFKKWAKAHNVEVPDALWAKVDLSHKD